MWLLLVAPVLGEAPLSTGHRERCSAGSMSPLSWKDVFVSLIQFLLPEMRLLSYFCLGFLELKIWCVAVRRVSSLVGLGYTWPLRAGHTAECGCVGIHCKWVCSCLGRVS